MFFCGENIAGEREYSKAGREHVIPFSLAYARVHPVISTKFGKCPSLARLYPFMSRCGWRYAGLAENYRRWVTVPARVCCGTPTRRPPTSERPTAQTLSNMISIGDQHTTPHGLNWFRDYCIPWSDPVCASHLVQPRGLQITQVTDNADKGK